MLTAMLSIAWAVLTGAAGFLAASARGSGDGGSTLGLFFFGPLGTLIGFVVCERALERAGGPRRRALGWMILVSGGYALAVYLVTPLLPG